MRTSRRIHAFTRLAQLSLLGGVLLLAAPANAQTTPEQSYQKALKHCHSLSDKSQRQNCQRDAGAALQEARRHPNKFQSIDEQTLMNNRLSRCNRLPDRQRELCIKSMTEGAETQKMGSIKGGGILRRTTVTERGTPIVVPVDQQSEQVKGTTKHPDMPTSNTNKPPQAKEPYGTHPIR